LIKSDNLNNLLTLYKYFSKLHTDIDVSLPILERSTKDGNYKVSENKNNYEDFI